VCQDVLSCDTVLVIHHTDCGAHAALFHTSSVAEHAKSKADELLGTHTGGGWVGGWVGSAGEGAGVVAVGGPT
jgi:hypothetical protein